MEEDIAREAMSKGGHIPMDGHEEKEPDGRQP